jgi:type I restriction enzyme M protein
VVANPPFSDQRRSTGINPLNDPHLRLQPFDMPRPNYACLLPIVRSPR